MIGSISIFRQFLISSSKILISISYPMDIWHRQNGPARDGPALTGQLNPSCLLNKLGNQSPSPPIALKLKKKKKIFM